MQLILVLGWVLHLVRRLRLLSLHGFYPGALVSSKMSKA